MLKLTDSNYLPIAEKIAPGFAAVLDNALGPSDKWYAALIDALPVQSLTTAQNSQMRVIAMDASIGIEAPALNDHDNARRPDFMKIISAIGAGIAVIRWII